MASFSTEVTSSKIVSDNPLYQRTFKAYNIIAKDVIGDTLEIGCGEGYGISSYIAKTNTLTLVDKSRKNLNKIKEEYPNCTYHSKKIPPLSFLKNNSFDTIISFQVIEHIKDYNLFLKEIYRVLKPGGKVYISTPNKKKTIARNPWHHREFDHNELEITLKSIFPKYEILGIEGNSKTKNYYSKSNQSVKNILALDVFKLHQVLPSSFLKIPYEILNRINRLSLLRKNNNLIEAINLDDYKLKNYNENTLDFFCILSK